ncbi:MAG: NAD(P)-dependent oxidoreductase [Telluria sp.]
MPLPTIAFLGLGLMGRPMAARLAAAGHPVRGWNRTTAKSAGIPGVQSMATVEGAVAGCDIVISMVSDGAAVWNCVEAALPALADQALWIDMSSTSHAEALDVAAMLPAFLDAPVSGGVAGAEAGALAIMAGGSAADFARAEPVLRVLGRPTLVGPAGSGQVAKLCNQLIVGGTINIVAEALLLAQAAGADPAAVRTAIRGGFAESRVLEVHGQRMLDRNFIPGGQVKTQLKDMDNVLAAAAEAGVVLPVSALVREHYLAIVAALPQADHAAALIALERMNPGQRVGDAPDQLP